MEAGNAGVIEAIKNMTEVVVLDESLEDEFELRAATGRVWSFELNYPVAIRSSC